MRLGNPIEVVPAVYQLRAIGARVTVLATDEGVVLVDAGTRGSLGAISSGLEALDLSVAQVSLIVVTHYHPDHSGGLAELVKVSSAKVAVHRLDAGIVSGKDPVPSPYRNQLLADITRPFMSPLYGEPVEVDYVLEDGDLLPVGEGIRVVHVPGHTAGSICLFVASKKVVIVGDALQYKFASRLSTPAPTFTQDLGQAAESLKKLLAFEFDSICFGHFPPLRQGARDSLRQLVEENGT